MYEYASAADSNGGVACPARAQEGDNLRFSPSCESSAFPWRVWRKPETGDRCEIGVRQRIFSSVGEHSVLPFPCLYAVSDTLLLHRRKAPANLGIRYNLSAQVLSIITRKRFVRHCHAALCVDYTTCVAERYLTLRICGYMDAQSTSCGRKNPLPFPYSLSSLIAAVPSGKG